MARLKDVNFSQSGGEEEVRKSRKIEESNDAIQAAPETASTTTFRIFKLTDTNKKGNYHMEGIDDIFDPEKKKMVRVRLLRGHPSIYLEDQKGIDEKYILSNRRSLIFEKGMLRVPDYDASAIEFLEKCNANVDNPNKKGTRKITFFEWNPKRQAELERKKRIAKVEAIKFASMTSDEDMQKHAVYLGIPLFDETGLPKTVEALRNDYELYAESQPAKFMQSAGSKEVEVAYIVKSAIVEGKIDLGVKAGYAYWANDGGFICKIPVNIPANKYLVEFALQQTDDSIAFLNQLKKMQN